MPWPKHAAGSPRAIGPRQRREIGQRGLLRVSERRAVAVAQRRRPGMSSSGAPASSARASATSVSSASWRHDRVDLGEVAQELARGERREVPARRDVPAVARLRAARPRARGSRWRATGTRATGPPPAAARARGGFVPGRRENPPADSRQGRARRFRTPSAWRRYRRLRFSSSSRPQSAAHAIPSFCTFSATRVSARPFDNRGSAGERASESAGGSDMTVAIAPPKVVDETGAPRR